MPNTSASKKSLRQNERRRARNAKKKKKLKDTIKSFEKTVESGEIEKASDMFSEVQKIIDKAAKTNIIHENKAARTKSRLTKKLENASS